MYKMLEQDDEQSRMNEIKRQILEDLEKFSTRSTLPQIISSKEFNLKKVIYRSTTLFISALGRLYNVHASSSFEIIKHLAQRGPTTGSRAACGPRNNFAQVLSITSSRNFFLENV